MEPTAWSAEPTSASRGQDGTILSATTAGGLVGAVLGLPAYAPF